MTTFKTLEAGCAKKHPVNEIRLLLAAASAKDITYVHAHPEHILKLSEHIRFKWYSHQRTRGYSIASIIGHKDFFGLDFFVSKHTLIPRPDTEVLVEEALKILSDNNTLIDVGTGSGCIPIALLKKTPAKNITAYATDISRKALRIARKNAKQHNASIIFKKGNLLSPLLPRITANKSPIVITANLPYLTQQQFDEEPSIQREPHNALVADKNGLALYETLLKQLQSTGATSKITAFFEIDPSQKQSLLDLIHSYFPYAQTVLKNDLAGRDRLVIMTI